MQYKFLKITTSSEETKFEWEIFNTENEDDKLFLNTFLEGGFTLDEDGREELEDELIIFLYEDVCEYDEKIIFMKEREVMDLKLFLRK